METVSNNCVQLRSYRLKVSCSLNLFLCMGKSHRDAGRSLWCIAHPANLQGFWKAFPGTASSSSVPNAWETWLPKVIWQTNHFQDHSPKRRIWNDEHWILFPRLSNSKYSALKLLHLQMKETFHPRMEDQGPSMASLWFWHHVRQTVDCSNNLTGSSSYCKVHLWTVHRIERCEDHCHRETGANTTPDCGLRSDDRLDLIACQAPIVRMESTLAATKANPKAFPLKLKYKLQKHVQSGGCAHVNLSNPCLLTWWKQTQSRDRRAKSFGMRASQPATSGEDASKSLASTHVGVVHPPFQTWAC